MTSHRRPSSRKSIAHLPSPNVDPAQDGKVNATEDLKTLLQPTNASATASYSKTRSKSLGPSGLDALNEVAGNRRKSAAAPPKSILKPSIPLSPLKEIPIRRSQTPEQKSVSPTKSPQKSPQKSQPSPAKAGGPDLSVVSSTKQYVSPTRATTPRSSPSKASRSAATPGPEPIPEEDPDEDSAKEQRRIQREQIERQRDARRKSMANRRVSFAPEATLHTWDHLEDMQDSTSSSASTDATRRASALSIDSDDGDSTTARDAEELPSTPPEQVEEKHWADSHERPDSHQKPRQRRSSGVPPMNFNNPNDTFSSSPYSIASTTGDGATITGHLSNNGQANSPISGSDSGSTREMYSPSQVLVDQGDATNRINANVADVEHEAIGGEQYGRMAMGIVSENNGPEPFSPLLQEASKADVSGAKLAIDPAQEKLNPFSPAFKHGMSPSQFPRPTATRNDGNDNMSMDITRAVGGIVQTRGSQSSSGGPVNVSPRRRQSVLQRRRSSGGSSAFGDDSMDFTAAVGGIQPNMNGANDTSQIDQNEELSMEFTSVFGGIRGKSDHKSLALVGDGGFVDGQLLKEDQRAGLDLDMDGDMEMTTALGRILQTEGLHQISEDEDQDMEMTKAVGSILGNKACTTSNKAALKVADSPARSYGVKSPLKSVKLSPKRPSTPASATASPSVKTRQYQGRLLASGTPVKSPLTPSKQVTPQPSKPTTPGKTPPSKNVAMRHPSPRQLFRREIHQAKASPLPAQSNLFQQIVEGGTTRPSVVLAPKNRPFRRTSGVGIDREGLVSPQIAALLDRRASIGDQADVFAPQSYETREVRFQDPRAMEAEVSRERENDIRRESGQFILETEAGAELEDKDATITLKEAIGSMTPKKDKPKVRKSLAVGAARGLLGKRPIELDEDDEDGTPKGLRGREASPLKKIRLRAPPSASETIGRPSKPRHSLGATAGNELPRTPMINSPIKRSAVTAPSHKGHFKDAEALPSAQKPLPVLGQTEPSDGANLAEAEAEDQDAISLQDFLNLTNIRFMELNTTKRRHTVAPTPDREQNGRQNEQGQDLSRAFEDAVVAGACTLPMLEMYQHSCRELKKYISDGRKIVREIEANTYEDNPAVFREYLTASPSDRAIMDNKFKNMKTHARLLSKGMWYEWRMKLLEGLRGVLVHESGGLNQDNQRSEEQGNALQEILPNLLEEHSELQSECSVLQDRANELADCDQEELKRARQRILSIDEQLRQRRQQIDKLKTQSKNLDAAVEDAADAKIENLQAIRESERVFEEHRGWSASEVNKHKWSVDALETEHGWSIATSSSTQLTMVYQDQLEIQFDVASFLPVFSSSAQTPNKGSPISLSFIGDAKEYQPQMLTTEKRFFLQLMRAHLQCLPQSELHVKDLLHFVGTSWTQALAVAEEIRRLNLESITECSILGDERLEVKCMVLLPDVKTKINVCFEVDTVAKGSEVTIKLKTKAEVVYGEEYSKDKMKDFLRSRIGEGVDGAGNWADAVRQLKKKLVAQGKK